jgi:hypothetical protein
MHGAKIKTFMLLFHSLINPSLLSRPFYLSVLSSFISPVPSNLPFTINSLDKCLSRRAVTEVQR